MWQISINSRLERKNVEWCQRKAPDERKNLTKTEDTEEKRLVSKNIQLSPNFADRVYIEKLTKWQEDSNLLLGPKLSHPNKK
jgi:hypothetical protein